MDKLPLDVLSRIMGDVDKYEHLKLILATFTDEDLPKVCDIVNQVIPKFTLKQLPHLENISRSIDKQKEAIRSDILQQIQKIQDNVNEHNKQPNVERKKICVKLRYGGDVSKMFLKTINKKTITCYNIYYTTTPFLNQLKREEIDYKIAKLENILKVYLVAENAGEINDLNI